MKKGLVVEGGGVRAVFVSGCFDALLDYGIEFDYIIGVSAGIANAMSFVSKQKGRNLEVVTKFVNDPRYMGVKNFFDKNNRSYFGIDFAFNTIPNELVPFDYKTFNSFGGEVFAVLSNLDTGEAEYVNLVNNEFSRDYIIASCSLPFMFPKKIVGGKQYFDGGVCDPIPIQKAMEVGLDKVLVLLTREKSYRKKESRYGIFLNKFSKYPNFKKALLNRSKRYNFSVEIVNNLEDKGIVKVIRPNKTEKFSRTEKDISKITSLYQDGYDTIVQNIDDIKKYLSE